MKMKRKESIYILGYMFYVLSISLMLNVNIHLARVVKLVGLLLAAASIFQRPITDLLDVKKILAMAIVFLSAILSRSILPIVIALFAVSYCCEDFLTLVRIDFFTRLFGFALTLILFYLGFAKDVTLIRYRETGEIIRHSFGYNHPNTCFAMLVIIAIDFLVLFNKKRIQKPYFFVVLIPAVLFFQVGTGSRSGVVALLFICVMHFMEHPFRWLSKHKWITYILVAMPLIICVASVLMTVLYDKIPFLRNVLNAISTNRLSSMYFFWNKYNITLFGQVLQKLGTQQAMELNTSALVLDNMYLNLLLGYGVAFTVLFLTLYLKTGLVLAKKEEYALLSVFAGFAIYGFFEGTTLNFDYNYFLVLVGTTQEYRISGLVIDFFSKRDPGNGQ